MKRWLFLVAGLLFAVPAVSAINDGEKLSRPFGDPIAGFDLSDTTLKVLEAVSGRLSVDDIDRDRDSEFSAALWQSKLYANASSNSVDSSAVLDTQGWKYKSIAFSVTVKDSLSPTVALFAISMRGHLAASHDTLTTFPIMPFKAVRATPTTQPMLPDTLGVVRANTNEGDITGDATPYEILIPIYPTSVAPRFKSINLNEVFGETGFRYTSYRVRLVGVYNGSGTNVVGNATIAGTLVGQR